MGFTESGFFADEKITESGEIVVDGLTESGELVFDISTAKPYIDLKTIVAIRGFRQIDVKTVFCIRRLNEDVKTIFTVSRFLSKVIKTLFTVRRKLLTNNKHDLKTVFTVNTLSAAKEVPILFFINGMYIKQITLHGKILDSDLQDKKRRSEKQVKVIIEGNIYV